LSLSGHGELPSIIRPNLDAPGVMSGENDREVRDGFLFSPADGSGKFQGVDQGGENQGRWRKQI
jgi:hypothetical protein